MGSEFDPAGTDAGYSVENPNEVDTEAYQPPSDTQDPYEVAYDSDEEPAEFEPEQQQPAGPNYEEELKLYGGLDGVKQLHQQMQQLQHRYQTDPQFRAYFTGQQQQQQQPQQTQPQQGQFDPNNPEAFWTNAFYNPQQYFVTPNQLQQFQQQLTQQLATLQAHLQYQQYRPEIEAMSPDLKAKVQQGRIRLEDAVDIHRAQRGAARQPSPGDIKRERGSQERHDATGSKGKGADKSALLNKPAKSARGAFLKAKAQLAQGAKAGERLDS